MTTDRFPHSNSFKFNDQSISPQKVVDILQPFVSEGKKQRIDEVLLGRTYDITVVLENIHDAGNVNAVIRSCESLGVQSLHVIESIKIKEANRVASGADKWVDLFRWKDKKKSITSLKEKGYQIVATHLNAQSVPMTEVDFCRPTALVLGNEHEGISEEILELSDINCIIPTIGFTQSFNISVAAAILLNHIYYDRMNKHAGHGNLKQREREILKAIYYMKSYKSSQKVIENALKNNCP